jgi:glutaconate CoA-transferase subunit A
MEDQMLQKWVDEDKRMSAREAVERFVADGESLVIGNSLYSMPFALIHEIIRQHRKEMTLIQPAGIEDIDQLILGDCVNRVMTSYTFRIAGDRIQTVLEKALISGQIELEDYSIFSLSTALEAGAKGYPFLPVISGLRETDVYRIRSFDAGEKFGEVESPFNGETVLVVKACNPDVAVVHVQRADKFGNAQLWGSLINTKWSCLAAQKIIVSCEQIVDEETILSSPHLTLIPGFRVCAVVEAPWGAHPCELLGYYDYDIVFRALFYGNILTEEMAKAWMDEWIYGLENRAAYLKHYDERFERMPLEGLRTKPYPSVPVDYGTAERRPWDEQGVSPLLGVSREEFVRFLAEKGVLFDG